MGNHELIIIILNVVIVCIAYFIVYPRVAGSDFRKFVINDLFVSSISLAIAGCLFWNTGREFSVVVTTVNWFWFSILTYVALEIPFSMWYAKKFKVSPFSEFK